MQASKSLGTDELFDQYIEVVNRVIRENSDGLYGKAAKLWGKAFGDEPIAVGVYENDADNPHHWYTVKLRAGGHFELVERARQPSAKIRWKIKEDHLTHVIHNPQQYIERPLKLDIDWIKTRVGLR
jgi:hypothetical protein